MTWTNQWYNNGDRTKIAAYPNSKQLSLEKKKKGLNAVLNADQDKLIKVAKRAKRKLEMGSFHQVGSSEDNDRRLWCE